MSRHVLTSPFRTRGEGGEMHDRGEKHAKGAAEGAEGGREDRAATPLSHRHRHECTARDPSVLVHAR